MSQIYVRVKRKNQTFFIHCLPDETVIQLKQKLAKLVQRDPEDMRLYVDPNTTDTWLEDGKSLVQQDVKSDQIVYLVFRLEGDHVDDAFEEIDIVSDEHLELEEEEH